MIGPENLFSQELHATKYRGDGESFDDYAVRYARATADDDQHFRWLLEALRKQRLLPAGRQQLAVGRAFQITAMNCYVGETISDSMTGIMQAVTNGALTLRMGGGVGWDFSTIRPKGEPIRGLGIRSYSSGPVSFMNIWDSMSGTVMSAGHRRGAMMGVLRVDHPDILDFINAKQDQTTLANFNISLAVTDDFMAAVEADGLYELEWGGKTYNRVRALDVWSTIMERNWDWAEPGIIFIDQVNRKNNLWYAETLAASNPCGEQFLPPHGACLLGSINLVKYVVPAFTGAGHEFDLEVMAQDISAAVRAFDNVIDRTNYPLPEQAEQQRLKRRMGLGVTGMANALEAMGYSYGSPAYLKEQGKVLEFLRDTAYAESIRMAERKGSFPLFDAQKYLGGEFIRTLPAHIRDGIRDSGIRNSLLLSIAPTGTISLAADNVSSGIEPPYALQQTRLVHMPEGQREVELNDYAFAKWGVRGKTAYEVTAEEHVDVLCAAQAYVDNACSKTCNVLGQKPGETTGVPFTAFKQLYLRAYHGGAKGCTTFNVHGKRFGILTAKTEEQPAEGAACTIDPATGIRTCDGS